MKRTKDPVIWLRYLCYLLWEFLLDHGPKYPEFVHSWAVKKYGEGRVYTSWSDVDKWTRHDPDFVLPSHLTPAPWYIGQFAKGPLWPAWKKLISPIRNLSKYQHCWYFTNEESGVLWQR